MIGSRLFYDELILNGWKVTFWKFEILEKRQGPTLKIPAKTSFANANPGASNFANNRVWKIEQLPKSKSPLFAILVIFWHTWEDGSQKANMNAINFSPTP